MATKPMVFLKNIDFSYLWSVWPASTHCGQVKTLKEHQLLVEKAKAKNVLLQIEVENLDIWMIWTSTTDNFKYCFGMFSILHINIWIIIKFYHNDPYVCHRNDHYILTVSRFFQVHKRFDPIYSDARMRIQKLGQILRCHFFEKSLHQEHYHSHRHHNCFHHYSFASTSNWSCQRLSQPMNATL